MKSEKGITLISLTIYIIGLAIVIGLVAVMSTYFYKNTKILNTDIDPISEFTKFNSFFTDEINHENIKVLKWGLYENNYQDNGEKKTSYDSYILFDNQVQYTFVQANKAIYRNNAKIVRYVNDCTFEHFIQNGKFMVKVFLNINGRERTMTYTLKN